MDTRGTRAGFWGVYLIIITTFTGCFTKAYAQHQIISENFTDGDLQTGTKWEGDLSNFSSYADSTGNIWLRLNDEAATGESRLYTRSDVAYGKWTFTVRLDFNPSASNRLLVQLVSDRPDLTNGGNGYALMVGENGSGDVWRLVRYSDGAVTNEVLTGNTNLGNGGISKVELARNSKGEWTLSTAPKRTETPKLEAHGTDNVIKTSRYFGFTFSYTSTRSDKFYLDDIFVDARAAFLVYTNVDSGREVTVTYSLPVDAGSVKLHNFILDNTHTPDSSKVDTLGRLSLYFHPTVYPGNHSLFLGGLMDGYGYSIPDTSILVLWPYHAGRGDVAINEIMYKPPSGSPEYVELFNTTRFEIKLNGWSIGDSSNRYTLPGAKSLKPGAFLVLTADSTSLDDYFGTGNYMSLTDWPALNNTGDDIIIRDASGMAVDSLSYSPDWGGNGVSLERRSFDAPPWISSNWGNSPDSRGGTPGRPNEIAPDRAAPAIVGFSLSNRGDEIHLITDEPISATGDDQPRFSIDPSIEISSYRLQLKEISIQLRHNMTPGENYILRISNLADYFGNVADTTISFLFNPDRTPPDMLFASYNHQMDSVEVIFDETIIDKPGSQITVNDTPVESYKIDPADSAKLIIPVNWKSNAVSSGDDQIVVKGFTDRWGNAIVSQQMPVAKPWDKERLLINEIMYNPIENAHDNIPDQCEYVELYNDSNVSVDLRSSILHNQPDENGKFKVMQPAEANRIWIASHGYVVLFADTAASLRRSRLFQFFKPDSTKAHFYRVNGLSLGLSSDHDAVYLVQGTTTVDSVVYSGDWQNSELADTKGRSLERITLDGPSDNKDNWTTCTTELGGTPGKQNSVFEPTTVSSHNAANMLEITPNPFSPDGDGFHDNLVLSYHLSGSGYRLRVRIFDRYGRLIRTLANGKLAGSSGTLIWNGLDGNGRTNRIGFYIILFEAYGSNNGPDKEYKKTVVLARRLE